MPHTLTCSVCGGTEFRSAAVLWPELVAAWELSPEEAAYVDRQQGTACIACGANLRSLALARAVLDVLGLEPPLADVVERLPETLRILEVNEAGTLTPVLSRAKGWVAARFPEIDLHALPYPDGAFHLVLHSDTLEHVADPVRALSECRRVLRPGGACCYTVPIIVGRMTRRRDGLPRSHHGAPQTAADDLLVWTEYGADAWTHPMQAGFDRVSLTAVDYPSALALTCRG